MGDLGLGWWLFIIALLLFCVATGECGGRDYLGDYIDAQTQKVDE